VPHAGASNKKEEKMASLTYEWTNITGGPSGHFIATLLVYQDGRLAEKKTVGGLMGHINGVHMEEWAKRYCAKKKALKPAEPPAQ
jgi:hypothetical protein